MVAFENLSTPLPFSIAPSQDFSTPYVLALLGVIIAVAVLLFGFPSLRKYRRRRNILVYAVFFLVIALLVFQINEAASSSRRAVISYGYVGDQRYYNREENQLSMVSDNYGDRGASFYIVLTGLNASFQVKAEQDYIQTNSRTVKVPFSLQEAGLPLSEDSKPLFFTIDENVSEFSFSIWLEAQDYSHLVVASGVTGANYVWNVTENCFILVSHIAFT